MCAVFCEWSMLQFSNNKEEYVAFIDQIAHAFLADRNENPELRDLVQLHKLHRHQ